MLGATAETISHDLLEYGEEDVADWILSCSDEDLVRVCSVANWLTLHGPTSPNGSSMMIAKACALAAVYVREGAPRNLARGRRQRVDRKPSGAAERWPNYQLQSERPRDWGVGEGARSFWAN